MSEKTTLTLPVLLIAFMTTVCFAYNSSVLDIQSRQELDKVAAQLDHLSDYTIYLSGHTDNTGTGERNLQLSEERTLAVKNYFLSKNVDSTKFVLEFFGENKPLVSNTTEENMALNRRVEVIVRGEKITQPDSDHDSYGDIPYEKPKERKTVSKDETIVVPVTPELEKTKTHRHLVWTGWRTGFHWSTSGR